MADFGVDIFSVDDLDGGFELVTGTKALGQAIARRLGTPRGGLFYDRTYGYDLRAFLNADLDDVDIFAIAAATEAECERDERVQRATATVSLNTSTQRLRVAVELETAVGPFKLVLDVSSVTIELLSTAEA
jgi:phage baseplate assembly protein W